MSVVQPWSANDNQDGGRTGERRRERRSRVLLTGKLALLDASLTADCVIRNLSGGGAAIEVDSRLYLPPSPFLVVVKYAKAFWSTQVWTANGRTGLEFGKSWDLTTEAPAALSRIRNIWLELAPR